MFAGQLYQDTKIRSKGFADGHAVDEARFKWPSDLCQLRNGVILVSDLGNNCIRAITKNFKG